MSRGGYNYQAGLCREAGNNAAQARDIRARLLDVFADAGADLDHRLNHLGLDLLAQQHPAFVEELRDMRAQLTRLWIDDLKLFFNSECELAEHNQIFASRCLEFKLH